MLWQCTYEAQGSVKIRSHGRAQTTITMISHYTAMLVGIRLRTVMKAGGDGRMQWAQKVLAVTIDELAHSKSGDIHPHCKEVLAQELDMALCLMYLGCLELALDSLLEAVRLVSQHDLSKELVVRRLHQEKDVGNLSKLPSDLRWHIGNVLASMRGPYQYASEDAHSL